MSDKKTHWPFGGFFLKLSDEENGTHEYEDYLKECEEEKQLPEEELEFHCAKDPKKMTMQESLEEVGKFLRWNKMTLEERRAELEAQKAATCATEQAAGDMPCAMEPESAPDTPQGAVLDEAMDAPPGVDSVPGDVSGDAPESAADTVPDNVPDATEGYVPERVRDTAPDSVQDDDLDTTRETAPDAAKGNAPDAIGALTAPEKEAVNATVQGGIAPEATAAETLMQQGTEPTRQEAEAEEISSSQTPEPTELQEKGCTGQEAEEVPEVEVVPAEAIVPLGQIGGDAPVEKEQWVYASELIGDAFQHWENGRVLLDMGTGRGKNEFIIKRLVSWRVDEMLKNTTIGRVLCLCPLNTLYDEMLHRRTEAAIAEADGEPTEIAMTYDALYESTLEVQTYQYIEARYRNDPASLKKHLEDFKYIVAYECHYFTDFSSYGMNTYLSLEVLQKAEADHVVI